MNRNNIHLLSIVLENTQSEIGTTKLLQKTNTNHSRLKFLVEKLTTANLIVSFENKHVITEKGRIVLESWKKFNDLAETFGLEI